MRRFILTGAPGAGKTALLRRFEAAGYAVVEEAATDLIALTTARGHQQHWDGPDAIDNLVALQRARQIRADYWPDDVVIFDRSPICTWALAEFMGRAPSPGLVAECERIVAEGVYEPRVLLLDLLGFITPTEARRITLADSQAFEAVHVAAYERFGFELIRIPPADVETRFAAALAAMGL
ncbi:MAG TPA: AAA family ATPase [Caulobacteraceae bacterium]|jgi:predicted ATPase